MLHMLVSSTPSRAAVQRANLAPADPAGQAAQISSKLERWFGAPLAVFTEQGDQPLYVPARLPPVDWSAMAERMQAAGRGNQACWLAEEEPLGLLALPVNNASGQRLIAAGLFLTTAPQAGVNLERAARAFGLPAHTAVDWAAGQLVQDPAMLERLATLTIENLQAEQRAQQLEQEVENLSSNITATFEEISLIYRLTQNLKLSEDMEALGGLILSWLLEAVPAEGLAFQYASAPRRDALNGPSGESVLRTVGNCPVDAPAFSRLLGNLQIGVPGRPLVFNRPATTQPTWNFPAIRELVLVPIAEGRRLFGWLAAFNHRKGGEFGTSEANLLSSLGAILGIHGSNIDLYKQQADDLASVVRAMSLAIDAKDPYTRGHSDRVAQVAVRIAQQLGSPPETLKTIYLSGLLHDIGKIGIDDNVLRKPGRLTDAEFEHVKQHTEIGYRILRDLRNMAPVLPAVLHHHEAWDGSGYPYGLAGMNIPFLARVIAVADAYDAMASDRPYRTGMPEEKIEKIMRSGSGSQWDPDVIEAFFGVRDSIQDIYRREGHRNEIAWLELS